MAIGRKEMHLILRELRCGRKVEAARYHRHGAANAFTADGTKKRYLELFNGIDRYIITIT